MKPGSIALVVALAAISFSASAAESAPAATPVKKGDVAAKLTDEQLAKVGKTGFNRNWTVDELYREANLAINAGGRSFQRGEKVWDVVGCAICHHFGGGTGGIGPNLTGVGSRFGAQEILESIIEPSAVIDDMFGTVTVSTSDGRRYTGRPQGATDTTYPIVGAPSIDPTTGTMAWIGPVISIPSDKIVSVDPSGISPMPPGLINGLTRDEIYDFMAFLVSGGNPNDKAFQAARSDFPPPPVK